MLQHRALRCTLPCHVVPATIYGCSTYGSGGAFYAVGNSVAGSTFILGDKASSKVSHPLLKADASVVIESTSAFFTGGAVYIGDNVRAIVNRVYIRQSTAIAGNGGGGVFLSTLGSYVALSMPRSDGLARLTVCVCCGVRCRLSTITDLHVVDGVANFGHGGGLLMSDIGADGPTLPELTFVAATRCRSTQNGGGIALNSVRFMRMEDFTVTDCFANKAAGGGMSVVAASALALTRGAVCPPHGQPVPPPRIGEGAAQYGVKNLEVRVKGPGPGREAAVRSLNGSGLACGTADGSPPAVVGW